MSIKDKIRDTMVKCGLWAATVAPMAPTSAEAATPEAPEQPKTEQYAPNQELDNNNDGKTSNGFRLTPIDQNSPEAIKLKNGNTNTQTNTNTRTRTNTTTRQAVRRSTQNNLMEGTPEWARANGWRRSIRLSNGLNRLGASDGSHGGYEGAYIKPGGDDVMFLPNDPIHDRVEFNPLAGTIACQKQNTHWYSHSNHSRYGCCPDQKIKAPVYNRHGRAARIIHGATVTLDEIRRVNHGR